MTPPASSDPMPCGKCGQPHARCRAHRKSDGEPCTQRPMHGQGVCKVHGGMASQNRTAAARRLEEDAARAAVVTLGLPVDISPSDALLEEVRWTAGHVQWLRAKVQQLEDPSLVRAHEGWGVDDTGAPRNAHALTWGQTEYRDTTGGENAGTTTVEKAAPSIWYVLYESERKHLITVCSHALKAGVEERRVRLAEAQGEQVAGAIRAILADLGLTSDQQARVSEVVPRHLRLLAGGAA